MHVAKAELSNFRNYRQLSLDLLPGKTLISGENGHGKTNLIEALYFLSHQSSHRVSNNRDLISNAMDSAAISARVVANGRELLPGVQLNRSETNRFFLNGNKVAKPSEVSGVLRTVMFSPEDIALVRGDPAERRTFLDDALVQMSPKQAILKTNYDRVLKQRNALLKSARANGLGDASTLEIWDEQLAEFGSLLITERLSLMNSIAPLIQNFYQALSGNSDSVQLEMKSTVWGWSEEDEDSGTQTPTPNNDLKNQFIQVLRESRRAELDRGISLYGPHRDDLRISLNSQPAKTQASQGEAWSLALGLKLAVAQLYRELDAAGDPVLLLDDVFSVLDNGRRARLMSFVNDYEQVLVTSTSNSVDEITNWAQTLEVNSGVVTTNA